ncbi:hypothetical protein [Roseateles violae]|uniref:Uncharacterized protein n=1 Tax=Roseateles violae TaxID=3058042 RepID=A0ABT8DVD0_9BURK|nr:hypothetical protein [Pelomonas sp. PFR6]MDN3922227.1 hypothetical protein [Pelomonas sp. PFR6]
MESPSKHKQTLLRQPARWLVVIDSGGYTVARLFLETREQIAEFDASTEETASMISGLSATRGAAGAEWDRALAGHSAEERAAAEVYQLQV